MAACGDMRRLGGAERALAAPRLKPMSAKCLRQSVAHQPSALLLLPEGLERFVQYCVHTLSENLHLSVLVLNFVCHMGRFGSELSVGWTGIQQRWRLKLLTQCSRRRSRQQHAQNVRGTASRLRLAWRERTRVHDENSFPMDFFHVGRHHKLM